MKEHPSFQAQRHNSIANFPSGEQSFECLINSTERLNAHLFHQAMRLHEWNIMENCRKKDNNEAVILLRHSRSHCSLKRFCLVCSHSHSAVGSIVPLRTVLAELRMNENNKISVTLNCIKSRYEGASLYLSGSLENHKILTVSSTN